MKRIYSNYSDEEYEIIQNLAQEQGFTLSSFQKYCVMMTANNSGNQTTVSVLIDKMHTVLDAFEKDKPFIVSSLLPDEWPNLSRNDKMTISLALKKYVDEHSSEFRINKKIRSNINQYVRF